MSIEVAVVDKDTVREVRLGKESIGRDGEIMVVVLVVGFVPSHGVGEFTAEGFVAVQQRHQGAAGKTFATDGTG